MRVTDTANISVIILRYILIYRDCVCGDRLLREPAPALNGLPGQWLAALLERIRAPGQGRDDIVRRSAGLPFAFVALFLAEPVGSHKVRISWHRLQPYWHYGPIGNLALTPATC